MKPVSCPTLAQMNAMTEKAFKAKLPELFALILERMRAEALEGYSSTFLTDDNDEEIPCPHSDSNISADEFYHYYKPALEKWFKRSCLQVVWGTDPEKIDLTIRWGLSVKNEPPA
jgi:hypothetical protein